MFWECQNGKQLVSVRNNVDDQLSFIASLRNCCPTEFNCCIYKPVQADPSVLLDPVVAVMAETATSMQVCSSGADSIEL